MGGAEHLDSLELVSTQTKQMVTWTSPSPPDFPAWIADSLGLGYQLSTPLLRLGLEIANNNRWY